MCPTGTSLHTTPSSSSQTPNLRSAFDVLDADHDGKISREDLQSIYGGFLGVMSPKEDVIGSMITMADANKDGFVEFDEFEKVVEGGEGLDGGIMEGVFKVMDKDGDGKVGVEDLKSYLRLAGMEASDEDVMAMVKLGGGDGKGVNYDGFLRILGGGLC